MKKLKTTLVLCFLFFCSGTFAQNCFNQIADQEVLMDEEDSNSMLLVMSNLDCFIGHGMDETDIKIFKSNAAWIGVVIVDILSTQKTVTYRDLHTKLMDIVQDEEYQSSKQTLSKLIDFFRLPADFANWEKDKLFLIDAGMTEEELSEFAVYLKKNADPSKTYEEVFRSYSDQMLSNDFDATEFELFAKQNTIDLEEVLSTSEEEMVPVILYFTGYAVANARKMEQMITDDLNIFMMLVEEFILIPMYCDDNTLIEQSKQFYSEELQKNITTEGELALYYQLTYFKRSDQPYFVGINSNMEKLAELNFNMNPDAIVKFMDELDNKFYGTMSIPDEFIIKE